MFSLNSLFIGVSGKHSRFVYPMSHSLMILIFTVPFLQTISLIWTLLSKDRLSKMASSAANTLYRAKPLLWWRAYNRQGANCMPSHTSQCKLQAAHASVSVLTMSRIGRRNFTNGEWLQHGGSLDTSKYTIGWVATEWAYLQGTRTRV